MVIQEPVPPGPGPGPLPMSIKDGFSPSENGEIPTPISKNSSTKASRSGRRRDRSVPLFSALQNKLFTMILHEYGEMRTLNCISCQCRLSCHRLCNRKQRRGPEFALALPCRLVFYSVTNTRFRSYFVSLDAELCQLTVGLNPFT